MTPPMTPREKVVFKQPCKHCQRMTTVDLTALASSSGEHAELARLAEAATKGPWVCKEGSTSYPECDDKDFWSVVLSPAGKEIVTLHERYASESDDRGDYDFDAAFIAAANPATVLAILAENAALRAAAGALEGIGSARDRRQPFQSDTELLMQVEHEASEALSALQAGRKGGAR